MACVKERRQKNVKFGLSKDDSFEVEGAGFPCDEGSSFTSARDYWQHMCSSPEPDRRGDVSLICNGITYRDGVYLAPIVGFIGSWTCR